MKKLEQWAPDAAFAAALIGALLALLPPKPTAGFDLQAFARLPVLEGGRVKPIDSVARNSLLVIHGKQELCRDGKTMCSGADRLSADAWLLDVMFRPAIAETYAIFNVDNPDVLGLIGRRQLADRYLSFRDLGPSLAEIQRQGEGAREIESQRRSPFERAIVNLYERLILYHRLSNTLHPKGEGTLATLIDSRGQSDAAERNQAISELSAFRLLPPHAGQKEDGWKNVGESLAASGAGPAMGPVDARLPIFARVEQAWVDQQPADFNQAVADAATAIGAEQPALLAKAEREIVFNRAEPFYLGMVIYVLALLAVFFSWLWQPRLLRGVGFGLLAAGAVVHTLGLATRIALEGRPPVTNLYSSAVFVGWGVVMLGMIFERVYRKGFATGVAAAVGFSTLLIAHHLAADGDTMEMMRAVLDSNFWLATHVVAVTTGYAGTFLAGAIAVGYALRRQLVSNPDPETTKAIGGMAYGVICFSMLFSFVGTVLGGIWADQSWGRFWGWDPKENGALLIVLWNAIILHARMGGFVRERGLMAMAIFGNIVTSLSWFGVNMLGIGLHSYGFMDKAFWALSAFVVTQLALLAVCLLPDRVRAPAVQSGVPAGAHS